MSLCIGFFICLDFYRKTMITSAIIRNNRNYLLENIMMDNSLMSWLLNFNCATKAQIHLIGRQRSMRDKNAKLLYIIKSSDETQSSKLVKCLRKSNQIEVAKVIATGGGSLLTLHEISIMFIVYCFCYNPCYVRIRFVLG